MTKTRSKNSKKRMALLARASGSPRVLLGLIAAFVVVGAVVVVASHAATALFSDNFSSYGRAQHRCMSDGTAFRSWKVVFAGGGCTKVVADNSGKSWLSQTPATATSPGVTHSALTVGPSFRAPYDYAVSLKTISQPRTGSAANPWEVGWAVWGYTDNTHFYYFAPKANGWELGKEDPSYPGNQRFLATGSTPTFAVGQTLNIDITQDATNAIVVKVNGTVITSFTDTERPYSTGKIGLYNEDSSAKFTNVVVSSLVTATPTPSPMPSTSSSPAPVGMRTLPDPLYGTTLDNDSGAGSSLASAQAASLKALPHMPTTRMVFDAGTTPADYTTAINAMQPVSYILGLPVDSSDMTKYSLSQYHNRFAQFLSGLGGQVDLWEVGNEVNGNWTGAYSDVSAKITDAYNQVAAAGKRSELTLYYNPNNCDGSSELDPINFTNQYVPASMRSGLNYVLLSYYETQCNNYRPSASVLQNYFTQLHSLYPNAKLGFGEVGLPNATTSATLVQAQSIASYYYGLQLGLPYYVGGYFWWYYAEDAVPTTKAIWPTLDAAMQTY